jgi:peroxiredoxin
MTILEGLNTQVMGISRDSMDTVKRFAEEFGITYPLISDGGGVVKKLYPGERINYLIDKTGTIRLIVRGVPDNRLIIDKVKALGLHK